jgi:hypothetical protein
MTRYIVAASPSAVALLSEQFFDFETICRQIVFDCRFVFNAFLVKPEKLEAQTMSNTPIVFLRRRAKQSLIALRFVNLRPTANKNSIMSRMKCEATALENREKRCNGQINYNPTRASCSSYCAAREPIEVSIIVQKACA